jgi:hypothetical protein
MFDCTHQMAFNIHPLSGTLYAQNYFNTSLQRQIDAMRSLIVSTEYFNVCSKLSSAVRFNNSLNWFNTVTNYMTLVKNIRTMLVEETVSYLDVLVNVALNSQVSRVVALLIIT